MNKREPILKHFNKTDIRVYKIRAFLFRFARENKLIGQRYLNICLRRKLLCFDAESGYSISALGMALVERHEAAFKKLHTDYLAEQKQRHKSTGRTMTDAQKQALAEGRVRKKAEREQQD